MLQQQVYVINTILMVIDAVCVILAGYGAYYVQVVPGRLSLEYGRLGFYRLGLDSDVFKQLLHGQVRPLRRFA